MLCGCGEGRGKGPRLGIEHRVKGSDLGVGMVAPELGGHRGLVARMELVAAVGVGVETQQDAAPVDAVVFALEDRRGPGVGVGRIAYPVRSHQSKNDVDKLPQIC